MFVFMCVGIFPIKHIIPCFRKCSNYTFRKYQIAIPPYNCTLMHLCSSIAHHASLWAPGAVLQKRGVAC